MLTLPERRSLFLYIGLLLVLVMAGCGKTQTTGMPPETAVKAIQVIQRDTPVMYEFVGEIEANEEAQVRANISGTILDKMINGGDVVYKGQPLFRIDRRQYDAARLNYQAQLSEAEASLSRVRRDVIRYRNLAEKGAIAQQMLDNILAEEQQAAAKVGACQARLNQAVYDVDDTVVISPLDGKIAVNDLLSTGNYVQAGQTVLATISTANPVKVRFSMSENEYLHFARLNTGTEWGQMLKLVLSDGTQYPLSGKVEQVDRGLAQQTGTLTLKALFDNPQGLLVPGMFARVVASGEMRTGALLIPQRAVQEMLGKTFVMVVAEGETAEMRVVKLGPKIGNLQIVEDGLIPQDRIVVEGFMKAQPGMALKVTMIGSDDLLIPETK